MGLGSTAKKLQTMADQAERLYERLNEVREQVLRTQETVEETNERVRELEAEVAAQRAVLDAVAAEQGLDPAALRESTDSGSTSPTADEPPSNE